MCACAYEYIYDVDVSTQANIYSENTAALGYDRSKYGWRDLAGRNPVEMSIDFYQ